MSARETMTQRPLTASKESDRDSDEEPLERKTEKTKGTAEELVELVAIHGARKWKTIAQSLPGRIGKQCRERWHNHLNPHINKSAWSCAEGRCLLLAHRSLGNRWAEIAKKLSWTERKKTAVGTR